VRVSPEKSSFKFGKKIKYLIFVIILFFIVRWAIDYISKYSGSVEDQEYFCDAEGVSGSSFVTKGVEFSGGATQSSQDAYTGKYSSKCKANQIYSMTLNLPNADALDTIRVSCAIKDELEHANITASIKGKACKFI